MSMYVKAVSVVMLLLAIFIAPVRAGDPVPGIDVSLEQIPGGNIRTTQTDEDGRYVFKKFFTHLSNPPFLKGGIGGLLGFGCGCAALGN